MAKKKTTAADDYNTRIRAQHAKTRDEIMAKRPGWDRAMLEEVTSSYGNRETPGLQDILDAIDKADALEARFAKH